LKATIREIESSCSVVDLGERRSTYLWGLALGWSAAIRPDTHLPTNGATLGPARHEGPSKGAPCAHCSGEEQAWANPGQKAMQCLLMCCADEARWAKLPSAERERIMGEYGQLLHELKTSGRLLAGAKLDQCASAVTVRQNDGNPALTDGPFAETKEQLGGYHLIECKDRDEAVSIALRFPTLAVGGSIEVRPVLRLE
jgi:hypothetical protein